MPRMSLRADTQSTTDTPLTAVIIALHVWFGEFVLNVAGRRMALAVQTEFWDLQHRREQTVNANFLVRVTKTVLIHKLNEFEHH